MITEKAINQAYESLNMMKETLSSTSYALAMSKDALEGAIAKGLVDGTITGKNQQMRDAVAKDVLSELFDAVEDAENKYNTILLHYTLARNEVERIRLIVRLLELTKGENDGMEEARN